MKPKRIAASFLNGSHKDHIKRWFIAYNGVALPHGFDSLDQAVYYLPDDPCYTIVNPTGIRLNLAACMKLLNVG